MTGLEIATAFILFPIAFYQKDLIVGKCSVSKTKVFHCKHFYVRNNILIRTSGLEIDVEGKFYT